MDALCGKILLLSFSNIKSWFQITTFEMSHTLSLPTALALLRNPQDSCHLKHNLNLRRMSNSVL